MERDVGERVDELYRADPDLFTAARNELAAGLKAEGRDGEASEVRSLRKPTVAAWAVNRLVRDAAGELGDLLEAGERLRAAQRGVMSGTSADAFRDAAARRRSLVNRLVERATDILEAAGRKSSGAIEDVRTTLEASSVSEEAAALVREARLAQPLMPPSGFDQAPPGLTLVKPRGAATRTDEEPETDAPSDDSDDGRTHARGKQDGRRAITELTRLATGAERRLERARAHEETARARVDRAERTLAEARASLRAAEAERRGVAVDAKRAQQAVEAAGRKRNPR